LKTLLRHFASGKKVHPLDNEQSTHYNDHYKDPRKMILKIYYYISTAMLHVGIGLKVGKEV
jgi:hypothetical protein